MPSGRGQLLPFLETLPTCLHIHGCQVHMQWLLLTEMGSFFVGGIWGLWGGVVKLSGGGMSSSGGCSVPPRVAFGKNEESESFSFEEATRAYAPWLGWCGWGESGHGLGKAEPYQYLL